MEHLVSKENVKEEIEEENTNEDDPYAYLERKNFTSEKFKIKLGNLPKYYGIGELKALLNAKLKLKCSKLKPMGKYRDSMFACFRDEESRSAALSTLNGFVWKKKELTAEIAKAIPDPLVRKRKIDEDGRDKDHKEPKMELTVEEEMRKSAAPLWNVPYAEQLEMKRQKIIQVLTKYARILLNTNPDLQEWVEFQKKENEGLICKLEEIHPSPMRDAYRNKCEFTIGVNGESGKRTVGFRVGTYASGTVNVGSIHSVPHIPSRMKDAVKVFEDFIENSKFEPFNPETHEGVWKQLTARLSMATDELMLIVVIGKENVSDDELSRISCELEQFFSSGVGKEIAVSSLYLMVTKRRIPGQKSVENLDDLQHLLGKTYIEETLLGLKFRISPRTFFQVNSSACEILLRNVAQIASVEENTTVVDVCCGAGTIGLCLSKNCLQVLGVEVCEQAVEDAKINAANNNVTNAEFYAGKAEEILSHVFLKAKGEKIVAIVDPPRGGLHHKAVMQLRSIPQLEKLVYLSCDPNAAMKSFCDMGRKMSKAYQGLPFVPVKAFAVDMFPYTNHCELVIYFERFTAISKSSNQIQ